MTEPYLILHKVRGEPAFDIAIRIACPVCQPPNTIVDIDDIEMCQACDEQGYWWILSTSGYRAYPYWHCSMNELSSVIGHGHCHQSDYNDQWDIPTMPPDARDCFACNDRQLPQDTFTVRANAKSLLQGLGLIKKVEIERRD